jgi:HPt (histidine-containing phosphotransfer) domain-containing protein
VTDLQTASAEQRARDVRALAHKLKGSAAAIGAEQLADMCDRLQQCAEHVDKSQLSDSVALVARLHAAAVERLGRQELLEASPNEHS